MRLVNLLHRRHASPCHSRLCVWKLANVSDISQIAQPHLASVIVYLDMSPFHQWLSYLPCHTLQIRLSSSV
jgi:hypothetical protein